MERHVKNLKELQELAAQWVRRLLPFTDRATVVGLTGELGAGKTSFVQGVAKALGITDHVTSPTFVLMKKYVVPSSGLLTTNYSLLTHIDAYRLDSGKDLKPFRFDELLADPSNLIMIEWQERVRESLPQDIIEIKLEVEGAGRRVRW